MTTAARPPTPQQLQQALRELQLARFHEEGGLWREASQHYVRAAQLAPTLVDSHLGLAKAAEALADWSLAERAHRNVLRIKPQPDTHWRLGVALFGQKKFAEALPYFRDHASRKPGFRVEMNIGICCSRLQQYEEAVVHFRRAVRLDPKQRQGHENLIVTLALAAQYDAIDDALGNARAHFPDDDEIGYLAADHALRARRHAEGFAGYRARFGARHAGIYARQLPFPPWQGEHFAGTLLVWAEQGLGDELLFASQLPDLRQRHADVVLECDARLLPLFARSFPGVRLLDRKRDDVLTWQPEHADCRQCAAGDLGKILRNRVEDFPAAAGWLKADPARAAALRAKYRQLFPGERLVGLSWFSKQGGLGATKSLPLLELAPLLQTPGLRFINLQYGDHAEEIARCRAELGVEIHSDPDIDNWQDLDGFAAQIMALDHVVTTSNTTVHFAGALGVPTELMLNRHLGMMWYWGYDGERTPWYPSVRMHRTVVRNDWAPVVRSVGAALAGG